MLQSTRAYQESRVALSAPTAIAVEAFVRATIDAMEKRKYSRRR